MLTTPPTERRFTADEMICAAERLRYACSCPPGEGCTRCDAAAMLCQAASLAGGSPPPAVAQVPRCATCDHFSVDENYNAIPVGVCGRNHSFGWPADGSGYCHLHSEAS